MIDKKADVRPPTGYLNYNLNLNLLLNIFNRKLTNLESREKSNGHVWCYF